MKMMVKLLGAAFFILHSSFFISACNPEPDESDLFTATGETAADFIKRKAELTSFDYILNRVGLDRSLAAYGEYTCFIPNNQAVDAYLNKLWNDPEAATPHNGMTELSLEGLTDSLCNDIAKYHLASGTHNTIEIGGGGTTVSTLLGQPFQTSTDSLGYVRLNQSAAIIEPDSIVTNGIVHVIDSVIPRNTRLIVSELERHSEYSIFAEAMKLTGLADSLTKAKKNRTYEITDRNDNNATRDPLYWPQECRIMYTIFAEPNSVMAENGINSIEDLIKFANDTYGSAADWYDYLNETGHTVSTGTDYTNRFNALNMFVAYHILYAGMPQNELTFEYSTRWNNYWNYVNNTAPFDYYETMLPNTLLKVWEATPRGTQVFLNRYVRLNTLTDEIGTMGSAEMHELVRPGVRVCRTTDSDISQNANDHSTPHTNIQTFNGYIHGIRSMLVYDRQVPKGVLHERLRFDTTTYLVEFINNGIRMSTSSEMSALNGGGSGNRVAFPLDFFDNVVSYTSENRFRYNIKGAYNAWQGDTFQGWGNYDLAVKLPPLPTGNYEFRIFYTPMGHGGMMQFYMGTSSRLSSMRAIDIPLDVRIAIDDPRIGWTNYLEEDDQGVATDAAMRNHGYMRGLYSYQDHPERNEQRTGLNTDRNMRYTTTGNNSLRKIMGRFEMKQSQDYWFRIKSVLPDENDLKWQFDYIEFMPVELVDNDTYTEDWF
jgi:uncharacterized surface protein with fasciclin (FAS1) repeats